MDDGQPVSLDAAEEFAPLSRASWIAQFWYWLTATRSGWVAIWAVISFGLAVAVVFGHVFGPWAGLLDAPIEKTAFIGAFALVLLPCLLLLLDSTENLQNGPALRLPLTSLFLLVALSGVALADAWLLRHSVLGSATATPEQWAARIAFLGYFIVLFVPAVWNAINFGRYEKIRQKQIAAAHARRAGISEEQASEAIGALIATVVAIIVGVAAYLAGQAQTPLAFENFYGLVLCAMVIGVFTVITFLEALSETVWVQTLARHMRAFARRVQFLASFYAWIDEGMARVGAGIAGMGQRKAGPRYLILAGSLICLCVMAWYLPAPLGLFPAFIGLVIAISVSRLWAWVESDRALAAMTEYRLNAPYRVGFREDFRDEAMLAFAFVFILLPIAMMQAHTGRVFGGPLFDGGDHRSFLDWFGFFGVELAKAIPIVNWSEVYNIRDGPDLIGFSSAPARHIVFLSRVTIDLVLIAALLQALAISERNRNQKRLFAAGYIRRFDELVERSEIGRAARATWLVGQGAGGFDFGKLGNDDVVDFRRYDPVRLKTIYWSSKHALVRDFIKELAAVSGGRIDLSTAMDLTRDIADTTKNPAEMTQAFARALEEHRRAVRLIDIDDIYNVLFDLRRVPGLRDFKFNLIDQTTKLIEPQVVLVRLSDFAGGSLADFQYVRRHIASLVPALAAGVHSAAIIEEVCVLWDSWSYEEQPHGPEYSAALRALKRRLKILRNKKI